MGMSFFRNGLAGLKMNTFHSQKSKIFLEKIKESVL